MGRSVGIVIIGNEVLSGKVADENSHFLCCELRKLGSEVRRIVTIPDEIDRVAETVADFASLFEWVITSGGIGPTHDDVTIQGIAAGFDVPVERSEELVQVLHLHFKEQLSESILKMADVPRGTELLHHGTLPWPVLRFRNVYIFPGIPRILRTKFHTVQEDFRGGAIHSRHVHVAEREDRLAEPLSAVARRYEAVRLGSYPILDGGDFRVVISLESRSCDDLKAASEALLDLLPEEIVQRVEDDPQCL